MTGKEKCRILRQIRNDIAAKNDLPAFEDTCTHQGECRGTCPKCESEVRSLEKALEKKRALRKRVALAGVSLGLCATLTGCTPEQISMAAKLLRPKPTPDVSITRTMGEVEVEMGEVEMPPEPDIIIEEMGEVPEIIMMPTEDTQDTEDTEDAQI